MSPNLGPISGMKWKTHLQRNRLSEILTRILFIYLFLFLQKEGIKIVWVEGGWPTFKFRVSRRPTFPTTNGNTPRSHTATHQSWPSHTGRPPRDPPKRSSTCLGQKKNFHIWKQKLHQAYVTYIYICIHI